MRGFSGVDAGLAASVFVLTFQLTAGTPAAYSWLGSD
jgi:hypothetical protein